MSTELEWKEFGFTINIMLAEYKVCNVTIAAAISGTQTDTAVPHQDGIPGTWAGQT